MSNNASNQLEVYSILDDIELGKYKSALTKATKALKKNKDSVLVKAMLAYATDRTGNPAAALQICAELMALKPSIVDDLTLQLISSVLRFSRKSDEIATLYSNASQAMPQNLEYATQYFMALVRVGNLKMQQLTALKMQKQFKDNKYFFWAVAAIYLQGVEAPTGSANIYFPLAEKMLEKAKEENRISSFEELYLYVLILEAQNKYLACVKLLSSDLAASLCKVEAELQHLVLKYMHLAGQTDSVLELSREALRNSPDDWRTHLSLVESLYSLILEEYETLESVNLEESSDFQRTATFLKELQKDSEGKVKGPFLGEIELFHKFGLFGKIEPCLVSYFTRFGSTISFFEDVKRYLNAIPDESRIGFVEALESSLQSLSNSAKDAVSSFRSRVNFHKVKFSLSNLLTEEESDSFIQILLEDYSFGLELGKDLKATERQYGDDCLVLAALLILERFDQNREKKSLLFRAILLLESGLQKSTYNFQMKIMLIRLYTFLGVSQPVVTHSLSLDVKQVLLDTLTYIYADDFERISPVNVSSRLVKKALAIYASNDKETPEMMIQAYKFGTYSKVPEFRNFQLRLSNSIQRAISVRQIALTEFLSLSRPTQIEELIKFAGGLDSQKFITSVSDIDALRDNRDRTMDINWKSGGMAQKSFFEILGDAQPFPAPRASWIQVYGAVSMAVKAWTVNEDIDANSLEVLLSVSEEANLAAHIVGQLTSVLQAKTLDTRKLDSVAAKLQEQVKRIKTTVVNVDSFDTAKQVHELFEAISFARIGCNILTKRNKNAPAYQKSLQSVEDDFKVYLSDMSSGLDIVSAVEFKRGCLDGGESEIPSVVPEDVVENVFSAVKASYKDFLGSLVDQLS
ncbi:N-acetyltransferase B complex non catalytic subunit-domain-containing protein [Obelidium mucronatum]|nr:N-acetyltransferase B complex non catalytic subunit-domain-containing protein [Obelidium mucronatum]